MERREEKTEEEMRRLIEHQQVDELLELSAKAGGKVPEPVRKFLCEAEKEPAFPFGIIPPSHLI